MAQRLEEIKKCDKLINSFLLRGNKFVEYACFQYFVFVKSTKSLNSFVNGLSRDMEAVKNAIALENNNGLPEGTVNKIKVSKRIMYGRCSFDTLKKKILLREDRRKPQQT